MTNENRLQGSIKSIAGPLVVGRDMQGVKMYDLVKVGKLKLMGEVIQLRNDTAYIQVYEDTSGLTTGEEIVSTDMPLSVELGPGLLGSILDGVGRPLPIIAEKTGTYITRGVEAPTINKERRYEFSPALKQGDDVVPGQIIGSVKETDLIEHYIMVPVGVVGRVKDIIPGTCTAKDVIARIQTAGGTHEITLAQWWPVRRSRPVKKKLDPAEMLVSGQRVFDTFFPLVKGGTAAIPGPFGSGKTVSQHQLAKWVNADIVVYIGCGERGNEMTEVLKEFPELIDPKTGKPLMERTVLIANTSNMPVAAREASIYTGITIAEYYRDMGYDVALMADSTSRWAEALREMSSRLEEMPGEEGYPAYLSSRLAQFYERAGKVVTLNNKNSSLSIIGAVSPPGGDFSEPVTQNTLRITKVFWGLDAKLAYKRHFPSINWLTSYSLYSDKLHSFYEKVDADFPDLINTAMSLLQKESELQEIVQLVGPDALPDNDRLVLHTARKLREDYLQQHAFHDIDSYCSLEKQHMMLKVIIDYHNVLNSFIKKGSKFVTLVDEKIDEQIARIKYQKDSKKYVANIYDMIEKTRPKSVSERKDETDKEGRDAQKKADEKKEQNAQNESRSNTRKETKKEVATETKKESTRAHSAYLSKESAKTSTRKSVSSNSRKSAAKKAKNKLRKNPKKRTKVKKSMAQNASKKVAKKPVKRSNSQKPSKSQRSNSKRKTAGKSSARKRPLSRKPKSRKVKS